MLNIDASNPNNFEIQSNTIIKGLSQQNKEQCLDQGCNLINNWPDNINSIGSNAFNNSNIYKIPSAWNNIITINSNAFKSNKLASLPSSWASINTIGNNAFEDNFISKLPSRWENVRIIGDEAFKNNRLVYIGDKTWNEVYTYTSVKPFSSAVDCPVYYDNAERCKNTGSAAGKARITGAETINYPNGGPYGTPFSRTWLHFTACENANDGDYYSVEAYRGGLYISPDYSGPRPSTYGFCKATTTTTTQSRGIFEKITNMGNDVFSNNKIQDFQAMKPPAGKTLQQIGLKGPGNNAIITINTENFNTYFTINNSNPNNIVAEMKPEYANKNYYNLQEMSSNIKTLIALNTSIVKLHTKWNDALKNIQIEGIFCTVPNTIPENLQNISLNTKTCNTPNYIEGNKTHLYLKTPNEITIIKTEYNSYPKTAARQSRIVKECITNIILIIY